MTYQEWKTQNNLTSTEVRAILAEYGLTYSTRTIQTWSRIGAPRAIDVIVRLRYEIIDLKWEISRLKIADAGEGI
jgi:transposase-like protein